MTRMIKIFWLKFIDDNDLVKFKLTCGIVIIIIGDILLWKEDKKYISQKRITNINRN